MAQNNTRQTVISTGKRDLMNHSAEIYETNDSVGLYPPSNRKNGGGLMQEISRQFSEAICRKNKTQMGFHKPQILNNNSLYNFDRANSNELSSKSKLGPRIATSVTHKIQTTKTLSSSVGF